AIRLGWLAGSTTEGDGTVPSPPTSDDGATSRASDAVVGPTVVARWATSYRGAGDERAWGVAVDRDGAVVVAGEVTDTGGHSDVLVAKLSKTGEEIWK